MPRRVITKINPVVSSGIATAAVYLLTFLFYLKGPESHSRPARELFAWFICLALLPLFWKGYQQISKADNPPIRTIVGFAAVFCLFAFLTIPFHSTDIFGYINRGWQETHYGQNSYTQFLNNIPNWQQDPMLRWHWIYNPNPYGFLFTLLARLLCWLGNGNWLLTLALFKATNVLTYVMMAWIIWSASRRLPYLKSATALYLFLWNPLILMHHIANGHNDILTGLFVGLALYLAITKRYLWIVPALVAATLLKFAPGVLIPVAIIFVIKNKSWKIAALSCLIGLALFGVVSFPYLRDWNSLLLEDMRGNATLIDNSLHSLLIHIFENLARVFSGLAPFHSFVNSAIKTVLRVGLLIFLLYQWLKIPKDFTVRKLTFKTVLILFALICVASSKFNAWYLGIILPSALLLEDDDDWLRRLVVLISGAELLSLTFFKQAYMLNYFVMIVIPAWMVFRQQRRHTRADHSTAQAVSHSAG
jgi:hypothetical protein